MSTIRSQSPPFIQQRQDILPSHCKLCYTAGSDVKGWVVPKVKVACPVVALDGDDGQGDTADFYVDVQDVQVLKNSDSLSSET